MPDLSFEQNINQSLEMHLSPRLLSMLKILSLPYADMVSEIEKASEENPFLEIEKHDSLIEYLKYLQTNKKAKKEVDFKEYPGLENIKDIDKTLHTFLVDQINKLELGEMENKIALELISDIDARGYLNGYDELKNKISKEFGVTGPKVDEILELVQTLEPEGVGARNLKECLLIQVNEFGFDNDMLQEKIAEVITDHLEALGNKGYKEIAGVLQITEDGVKEIKNFIENNLNPYPGSGFGEPEHQITPSFSITKEGKELKLVNRNNGDHYGNSKRFF
ncbi:hypothetical protein HZC34_07480 [Candidatus Saganbacteria bacterium]|nr:hypothetical protein [Candidatus Saganbacteria bacterium]